MVRVRTVLVIDDDPEWCDVIYRALGKAYPVEFATSAEEGLERARSIRPGVIILDVMMPGGQDGFSTLYDLKHSPETRDIPVVMLSSVNKMAQTDFDETEIGRHLGVTPAAFIEKPSSFAHLLKVVTRLMENPTDADPQ